MGMSKYDIARGCISDEIGDLGADDETHLKIMAMVDTLYDDCEKLIIPVPSITVIEYPEQTNSWNMAKCVYMVSHSARPQSNCTRFAIVEYGDEQLCQQHAGVLALAHLMSQQKDNM